jgi:hypothetical protein
LFFPFLKNYQIENNPKITLIFQAPKPSVEYLARTPSILPTTVYTSNGPTMEWKSQTHNMTANNYQNFREFHARSYQAQNEVDLTDNSSNESYDENIPMCFENNNQNFREFNARSYQAQNEFDLIDFSSNESYDENIPMCFENTNLYKPNVRQTDGEVNPKYKFNLKLKMKSLKHFKPTDAFRDYFENDFQPIHPLTLEHILWLQRYG